MASVFTGALATFGLTTSNSKAASSKPDPKRKKNETSYSAVDVG